MSSPLDVDRDGPSIGDARIAALADGEAVVVDGLVGSAAALAARAAAVALVDSLAPAGVGRGAERQLAPSLRSDRIAWLDGDGLAPPLAIVVAGMRDVARAVARAACLPLDVARPELQLARYAGDGARYDRHRDALRAPALPGTSPRRLTCVYYLNPGWRPTDGGALRAHDDPPRDIAPLLDRLVLFLSDRLEHEVLPSRAERWALTAWFRGP